MNPVAYRPARPAQDNDWKDMFRQWDIIPFLSVHAMCLWAFQTGVQPEYLLLAIGSYYLRMVGVTAGYHRYFAHRSYKTSRVFQFLLAFLAMTSAQKGVLWWAAHHRHHHKYSDREEDFHSPLQRGFWFSHVGWTLSEKHMRADLSLIKDFAHYPEICFLNRFYFIPPALYGLLIYLLWGFPGLIWGFFISTTALYHCTFFINSLTHMVGRVRYQSGDGSRNSFILAILCCGEGWHNNHHHYQSTANQGWYWWEIDFSYYTLVVLSWFGIVWDLRKPPPHIKADTIAAQSAKSVDQVIRRISDVYGMGTGNEVSSNLIAVSRIAMKPTYGLTGDRENSVNLAEPLVPYLS